MKNEAERRDLEFVLVTEDGVRVMRIRARESSRQEKSSESRDTDVLGSESVDKSSEVGSRTPTSIREYYNSRKKMIDEAIARMAETSMLPRNLFETALGGKRFRGVAVMLVAEALGASAKDAIPAAVAVELAHATSLDLDDIIDKDTMRRGRPARWVSEGVTKVILGGYGLLGLASKLVAEYGPQALKLWFDSWIEMVMGEAKDVLGGDAYEAVISAKTATLWGLATALGAIVANKRDKVQLARMYGRAMGMAFQIADDICDIVRADEAGRLPDNVSAKLFMFYLGVQSKFDKKEAEKRAIERLDYWVSVAEKYASKLTEDKVFRRLLRDYPGFTSRYMLDKCM
jgi:hypothetical protein